MSDPLPGASEVTTSRSLAGFENHFLLTWRDTRIGEAIERVRRRRGQWRYERHERIAIRRADALVPIATHITVAMNPGLRAHEVTIKQISGSEIRRGRAIREPRSGRWLIDYGGEPTRRAPADAVPAELVTVLMYSRARRYQSGQEAWRGTVLLPGRGFAVADMRVVATGPREFAVTITGRLGPAGAVRPASDRERSNSERVPAMRGRWRFTRYGNLARADDDNGVAALRVHPSRLAEPFEPPELVLAASIPVRGIRSSQVAPDALVIDPVDGAPPPRLPGQRVRVHGRTWRVQLHPGDRFAPALGDLPRSPGPVQTPAPRFRALADRIVAEAGADRRPLDTRAVIRALARATDRLIDDDLGAPVTEARAALALGRGDCTAHATLFYELARARGIPARLVTGYRLDGARLVRHRWALAAVDGAWLSVDPTHGEAPARARLLGLAAHGPAAAEMALIDETVFAGFAAAGARPDPNR